MRLVGAAATLAETDAHAGGPDHRDELEPGDVGENLRRPGLVGLPRDHGGRVAHQEDGQNEERDERDEEETHGGPIVRTKMEFYPPI